jgi:hypothetical protein
MPDPDRPETPRPAESPQREPEITEPDPPPLPHPIEVPPIGVPQDPPPPLKALSRD